MVSKLTLNSKSKKGDEDWIQFKSSNPNINYYKIHECSLLQLNEAIIELRQKKEQLPEFPLKKIQNDQYDLDEYFNFLTKDVINDMQFQKFLNKCSSQSTQRKKTQILKMNGNFHQLPTILEGMQESASQKISNINAGDEEEGIGRRQSSFYQNNRFPHITSSSIKNSVIQCDITKSDLNINQTKHNSRQSLKSDYANQNVIEFLFKSNEIISLVIIKCFFQINYGY